MAVSDSKESLIQAKQAMRESGESICGIIKRNLDMLRERDASANKGSYGKLLVIAGSPGMAGAAYLASYAAFRTGIGMVKLLGPECNRVILQTRLPEAMYASLCADKEEIIADSIRWADYVIIGPGLSRSTEAAGLIRTLWSADFRALLKDKKLLVLDADGLNLVAELGLEPGALCASTVVTPHVGEMSRLTGLGIGEIKRDPASAAARYAREHHVTVVLKDAVTTVAAAAAPDTPAGGVLRIDAGCGAMAKAGSGDVLCGFIAGTAAMLKGNIADAVPLAVWLHGRAGCLASERLGCHSILAGDMADFAGEAIRSACRPVKD